MSEEEEGKMKHGLELTTSPDSEPTRDKDEVKEGSKTNPCTSVANNGSNVSPGPASVSGTTTPTKSQGTSKGSISVQHPATMAEKGEPCLQQPVRSESSGHLPGSRYQGSGPASPSPSLSAKHYLRYSNQDGVADEDDDKGKNPQEDEDTNLGPPSPMDAPPLTRNQYARPDSAPGAFPRGLHPQSAQDYGVEYEEYSQTDGPRPPQPTNEYLAQATLVDGESEPFHETTTIPQAEVVTQHKFGCIPKSKHGKVLCIVAMIALCITATTGIVCGSGVCQSRDSDNSNGTPEEDNLQEQPSRFFNMSTLERVQQRDYVKCAGYFRNGLEIDRSPGSIHGFVAALCEAIAAMVLNDPNKVKFVSANSATWLQFLANQTVDVLSMPATFTMERDVRHTDTKVGFAFSAPFYYSGLRFAGHQDVMECIDQFDVSTGTCRDVVLCFGQGTRHKEIIAKYMPAAVVQIEKSTNDCIDQFVAGEVNAVAGEPGVTLTSKRFQDAGYTGDLFFSQNLLSREPNAIAAVDLDPEWANYVTYVMDALLAAEAIGLSQADAKDVLENNSSLPEAWRSGDPILIDRILKAVSAVGNYGELYNRTIQPAVPRAGLNLLNENNTTGLLYSFPFGYRNDEFDHTLEPGPKITELEERGTLRCGVHERPGFAELMGGPINGTITAGWFGMDVELCKAIAAALFRIEGGTLEIVSLDEGSGFMALEDGTVDVAAGQPVNFANKYLEPSTGLSYSFSPPYFYSDAATEDMFALATTKKDAKFSAFVYWTVMAIIYAEENGITHENATLMPPVNLFGVDNRQMFIDCIVRVGNYGDIYNKTVGSFLPRTGRNLLNTLEDGGFGPQQLAIPVV